VKRTPPDGGDPFSNAEFLEVYRDGFRRSPEAVAVIALDDRIVDVNAAGERLVGYPRAESVGKTTDELGWWAVFETLLYVRERSLGGRVDVTLASDETKLTVTIAAPKRTTEADASTAIGPTGLGTLSELLDAVGGALEVGTQASGTVVTATIPRVLV
jgi:PAS domain-containing protein